jgi:hypothetical protein
VFPLEEELQKLETQPFVGVSSARPSGLKKRHPLPQLVHTAAYAHRGEIGQFAVILVPPDAGASRRIEIPKLLDQAFGKGLESGTGLGLRHIEKPSSEGCV